MGRVAGTISVAAAVALLIAGCEQTISGTPVRTSHTEVGAMLWNPCTQMPDEVLHAWGVDPSSKHVVTDAQTGPVDARMCNWAMPSQKYFVGAVSTIYTLDQARQNTQTYDYHDITIGPRKALQSLQKSDTPGDNCWVSIEAGEGTIEVTVGWPYKQKITEDICALARTKATILEPYLPK